MALFDDLSHALFTHHGLASADAERLLGGIFERLVDYAHYHFADEEALMCSVGVDVRHIQAHEALHQQFVQQLGSLWASRATMVAPAETFAIFLIARLGLHILGIDHSLARQIATMAKGTSAQEAYEREIMVHDNSSPQVLLKMLGKRYQVLSAPSTALVHANQGLKRRVAQAVLDAMQRSTDLVARYGGEELGVLLPDADACGVHIVGARVRRSQEDAATLVAEAEAALFRANAAGRNQWCRAAAH